MRTFVMATVIVLCACGTTSTADKIGAEPGASKEDAGDTVLADGGVIGPDGGRIAPGADPVERSGTRLKVKTITGADGSRISAGLRDTQLNVDCFFAMAADGSTRCLPLQNSVTAATYFADSACKATLFWVQKGCARTSEYVADYRYATDVCAVPFYGVRSIGAAYTGTLYQRGSSSCAALATPSEVAIYATRDAFAVGPDVPPATFVSGTAGLQ